MTNKTVSAFSSGDIVLELKVIKAIFESPVQAIKARVTLKAVTRCRLVKVQGQTSDGTSTPSKRG
ncbi:hypothetical protein [Methanosarcina horonobensis]|uniref:hypothetical protein n=1 Tax=Methanosarcina horonobensis TaxID=418008 RepID=UPI000AA9B4A0|nr:hypothetical protein [Methanosarcina horonobensis]